MFNVLYEDNHLLVVDKPPGLATMGSVSGESMHALAADYLRKKYNKPGNVFVGIVSRLDSMTSGVLVLARTSKAASRLAPQFGGASKKQTTRADKIYLAAVEGTLSLSPGSVPLAPCTLLDHVCKDDAARRMRVVGAGTAGAQAAKMDVVVLGQVPGATVVAVKLHTGRKHQIRVQLADRGHCVWGDRKYGSKKPFAAGIALHSHLLQIEHPTLKTRLEFVSRVPKSWNSFSGGLPSPSRLRETLATAFDLPILA